VTQEWRREAFLCSTDKRYAGDNRLMILQRRHRRDRLAPRCRLILSWRCRGCQGLDCSSIKRVRELGLDRRESGWPLSTVGAWGRLRGCHLSTKGPGGRGRWCSGMGRESPVAQPRPLKFSRRPPSGEGGAKGEQPPRPLRKILRTKTITFPKDLPRAFSSQGRAGLRPPQGGRASGFTLRGLMGQRGGAPVAGWAWIPPDSALGQGPEQNTP